MERSLLSSNHPEKQFDVKLPMAGKVFALVCLFSLSTQFAVAQNKIAVNALPTGGKVVAGAATISSTSTATSATMNINQTSQRAVINWQTFNVGKNATVNFNQPNSSAVTLNRVVSATPSMIQGAINANGQVILVNPNGVTFGKGAEVNAAGVVASTLNISNQDFMNGKNIYSGNGEGKIVNKGTITATDPNGYIALLAPEIRNQGYLIARMGPSSSVALASGEKISLDFRGTQLIGVSIDKAAYKALIENKRIIETNGGLIIVAAGTARELMSSVIQNTGRISANSIVDNGGVIELVADNVTNSGSISANGSTNGVGGQVNIVGNNITLAANSKTTATGNLGGGSIQVGVGKTVATNTTPASAVNGNANTAAAPQTAAQILASNTQGAGTQAQTVSVEQGAVVDASAINSGNGGAIVIWSQVKTTVNGILKAVGGYLNGNGGLIETSSAGLVSLGKSLSIDTSSSKGSAGLWYVDPIDLTIDGASSAVISAALVNNNVSITVAGNTCPSLGGCTQNGSGNLTIASGADIIKQSGSLTTLTLTASGVFNLNANISGQNLDVIINSSIAYLNAGSTITANQVTVQAQTIYSYGNINSGSLSNLGSAIQLLGSALYISGNLTVGANLANSSNSTNSNSNTVSYNGTLIRQEDLPTYLAAANQTTLNLDQVYATMAANQASFTTAVNNQITLNGTESISIAATAQLLANGTTGGVIMATAPQINLVTSSNSSPSSGSQSIQGNGSLIQANGNNGPGGTISFTAANDFNINFATISASGSTDGGSIRLISSGGNLLMANSLIQTNGGTGRGGSLGVSGANSTTINSSTLEATGFSKGGSIMVGYDSAGKSIPFSQSTTIDASTILNANQTDGTNSTDGGLIETSGGTLVQLASINAGRGGMWLLDPYDYVVDSTQAGYFNMALNNGFSVSLNTLNPTYSDAGYTISISGKSGTGIIYINSDISSSSALSASASLTFTADTIRIGANISTQGSQTYNGNVVVLGAVRLITNGANLTITGTVSGGYVANQVLMLLGNGGYSILNNGTVILAGNLTDGAVATSITGGALSYSAALGYLWTPTYSSISSALVVGGGGGGGAYFGGGGGGGAVVSNDALSLSAGTTYKIGVGYGGIGFLGGNGSSGTASFIQSGSSTILTATGGLGGTASNGTGGMGGDGSYGGGSSPDVNGGGGGGGNASNGTSVSGSYAGAGGFGVISSITGYQAYYGVGGGGGAAYGGTPGGSTQVVLNSPGSPQAGTVGGNLTNGVGGVYTSAGCKGPCDGHYAMPNSGSGGGGGGGNGSTGGNGANGVIIIHIVADMTSTLTISTVNQTTAGNGGVYLSAVNGGGASSSKLTYLNITAGVAASRISGNIQGNMNLDFAGWSWNGVYGSMSFYGTNSYVGNTSVSGGTLQVASDTAFGAVGNTVNMVAGGAPTIDLNGHSLPAYTINVLGFGIGSKGALINSNVTTPASLSGAINLTGATYFGGPGAMVLTGMVNTQTYGLGFVNDISVNASNVQNYISTIAGSTTGTITIVSNTPLTVGAVNSLSGFSNVVGGLNLYGKDSLLIAKSITAQSIFLYGYSGSGIGVDIESATLHATNAGITIYGNGGWSGAGVYVGGQSLLITDSSSGNINISGYGPRLGVTFGGSGWSGNTTTTTTSPLTIYSANNISINGYADYAGTDGNIFGININVGLSGQYALLNTSGNGSIYLSGSTPYCNCSSYQNGAAISLVNTPLNSANGITMGGARLMNLGIVNGVSIGNVAASTFEGGLSLSSITSNQYANGGFQPYGVNISNSSTVQYAGQSYSNTVAAGSISIFGSSSSGIGVNSSSNFNSGSGSLEIGATGNGQSNAGGINLTGSITKGGAEAANISISSTYNVALGNITDTASAPIHITGGYGIAAGNTAGGTITHLGTITSNSPIALSMASAPTGTCTVASCPIAGALGITSANASTLTNIAYSTVGGAFVTPQNNLGGTFINYRQSLASNTYSVFFNSNYSATYGTAYNSSSANAWLQTNATVSAASLPFGLTASSIAAGLRFNNSIDGLTSANNVQSGTTIVSSSLSSIDGASVIVTGGITRTYTISPASLMVTANNQAMIYGASVPSLTYTYSGLVNGDSSASFTGNLVTTASSNSNIGTYGITQGSLAATGNYIIGSYNSASVAVAPAPLIVSAVAKTMVYGSSVPSLTYTYTGLVLSQSSTNFTGSLSTTATSSATVGGYTIGQGTLTATGNYVIASYVPANVTITPATLTITANADSKVYGATSTTAGLNYSAGVAVSATGYSATGLVNGDTITNVNFSSTGGSNTANVGTYTITPTSETGSTRTNSSNYNIVFNPGTMTVTPATLTYVATPTTSVYGTTPSVNAGTVTGFVNSQTLSSATSGTLSFATTATGASVVGGYAINGSGLTANNGNYTFTQAAGNSSALTITPATLTITTNNQTTTYGNALALGTTAFTTNGLVNSDAVTAATLKFSNSATVLATQNAGTYSNTGGIIASGASGTGLSNYAIVYIPGTLTVNKAVLNVTADAQSMTYGANALPSLTATISGFANSQTLASSGVTGSAALSTTATAYNGTAGSASVAGGYTITPTVGSLSAANYSFNYVNGTLTITPATLTITANADSKVYGATSTTAGLNYSAGVAVSATGYSATGLVNGDTITNVNFSSTGGSNTANVGTYTITPTSETGSTRTNSSNYNIVFNPGTMTVTPAPLSAVANAQTMAYGAAVPTLTYTYTGLVNNQSSTTFTGALSTTALSTSSVGTYAISQGNLAATGNYAITSYTPGYVTITPAALTITANNQNTTYGTSLNLGTSAFTVSGLVNGNSIANVNLVQGSNSIVPGSQAAGIYSGSNGIVASSATAGSNTTLSNYSITYMPGTLTITPATLTITANNQSTTYGSPLVLGSSAFTSSGLVNNDLINSVTLMQGGNSTVPVTQNAGTYSNTNGIIGSSASGAGLSNYSIVYVPGTLTINKAVLTVNPNAQSQVYNGATLNTTTYSDNVANYTITGYKNSDTSTNAPITLTGSMAFNPVVTANTTVTNVDTYHFGGGTLAGISSNSNYSVAFANASNNAYTITKAQLILSGSKVYDGNNTLTNSVVIGGLVGNQILNYSGATANSANVNAPGVSGATYISAITIADGANGGLASNYQLPTLANQNTSNTFSITPKTVTLSASKTYDSTTTLFAGQVTINTGITGEALTYSAGTINNANVSANGSNFITALTLNSLTGTASNYALPTLNSTNAPVTVNPAPLTVTGSVSPDKTYDGKTVTTVSNGQLQGLINNQTLTLSQAGAFASANAGTAINVVVNDSIANGTGTNAGIASNYSLTQPTDVVANITPKNLTVTGSATSNKVYDGTFTATITGGQLVGVVAADIANVVLTQTGTFTAANVGNAIAITANDSLSGTQAGNYSLTQPTVAAANITPKTLSLSATKTYDSTTSLLGAVTILTGVGTETLGYTAATASDANVVTTGKYITAITLVNGSGLASNYVLPVLNVANAPVTINPVTALVVVGATAQGKTYDGTTSVTLSNTGTLQGLIGNQTLTLTEAGAFTSANAGSGVFVVMNDRIADGTNGGLASNYSLTQPTYVMAPIAKAPLGVTVTGTYTASTTIAPSTFTTNGLVNNETITTLSSATVNDANVMTANNYVKSIVIGAGTANVNNYVIGPNYNNLAGNTQNMATITPKVITVSGTQVANKEYNATTTANLTGGTLVGVINSDSANVNLVQAGNFASANIGNPVAVTASDTITGSAASNYSLTQPTGLSAIITSKALTITIAAETKIYGDGIAKTSNSVDGTNTSSQSVNYTNGVATNSFQGFSVSGLVTGSNDAVNTVTLTSAGGALTAGVASGAAAYAITGSGAVGVNLGNYAINYVSNNYSVMTVTPRPLNVTVANASMAYGATALPNFTSTITGLVNGDQASAVLSTTATPYNGQAGSASNVGSYAITAAAVSNANYSVISTNGTLTVNPVTLVLQANTQGGTGSPIVYGTPTVLNQNASVALTPASLVGLTNGDYINTVSVTFNGSQTISGATAAGTYTGALVASGASGTGLSNYTISYQPGNLIISKAVLTVTAANDARFTSQTEATPYNGVIFSGFKNGETSSVLDMTQLVINRTNSTVNAIGSYTGVLIPQGVSSQNYTIQYQPGNYSILGSGQVLVKYAPITMNYGSVTNANINYGTPVVSYMAAGSNLVSSSDSLGTVTVNPTIANLQNSTAGYLNTGSYSLNPTATITSSTTNLSNLAVTVVGGITVMPKVLSFANLGISGVSKVYDGLTTMTGLSLNVATGIFLAQGPAADNVTVVANGAFTDKNVGTAKSYTVGVSFGGADANNYVISGGGVYIADGITNPANGAITQLSSVTYIGAATGGAWSDPNSWQVTNGTTKGAIPDASMVNGVATNNVANIIVPVGNTVVYDAGVSNAAPITSNLANAGNVSFGSALASNATFNVAMTISGAGSVTIAGPGTITLSGANTYTGNTIISNGSTLSVTVANSIGAGNIQGSGGSLRVANGISLAQINATGTLRLLSDVVTSGNQAWGNLTVTQSPLTTLTSTNGNITFNGLLDGASSKANSLLVLAPNGNVTFNNSVGSVMPLNVLEVDASRININADVLTSDQQNYCGIAGCYSQLSSAQVSANYCATTGNNCYSKNTSTLAYNLLASGTGTTGDYVLNTDIQGSLAPTAQVYIGDNGAVGFLYNTYGTYATKAFGSTPPLFQNNAVFARTLISKDPMVNFGGAINDASAASTHTLQAAAIKVSNASSPNIQFGGSIGNTNPLYSINALTQFIDAANSMNGSIKFAANTTITSISNMSYGSNSFTPTGVTFQTVSPSASINFVVPAGSPFSLAGGQIKSNYVNYNGAATRTLGGITAQVSLSGGIVTPRAAAPVSAPSTRNSFILAAVAEQTKIERKYDVDASVDVGEIETDDGPAAADDQDDKKKKKAGNQKAAQ
ncbi:filamentous hemagglutinin N-terminal domain-containing protein [Polynucleobacter paneuropaeus]|nr:filamentous hemagglutinin N-terminal domain-containing protein [Polynucleobacter paneuropaeus]